MPKPFHPILRWAFRIVLRDACLYVVLAILLYGLLWVSLTAIWRLVSQALTGK
jgi:hypothetical protein